MIEKRTAATLSRLPYRPFAGLVAHISRRVARALNRSLWRRFLRNKIVVFSPRGSVRDICRLDKAHPEVAEQFGLRILRDNSANRLALRIFARGAGCARREFPYLDSMGDPLIVFENGKRVDGVIIVRGATHYQRGASQTFNPSP